MLFKKLLAQSGDQTDIFGKFYSPADTLWSPKTVGRVLGYTTAFLYWTKTSFYSILIFCTNTMPGTLLSSSASGNDPSKSNCKIPGSTIFPILMIKLLWLSVRRQAPKTYPNTCKIPIVVCLRSVRVPLCGK